MAPRENKELELPLPEDISVPPLVETDQRHTALELLIVLAKHKALILYFVGGVCVLSVIGSLFLPNYYTSEAKLLPPQQGQSVAAAMMGELGQLGGLLGAVGGKDLLKNPGDVYVAMLRSRTVADTMIDRFALMSRYKADKRVDAEKKLDSLTEITLNKDGTLSIAVQDRDPRLASQMANAYIEALEKLTRTLAVTDASKRRVFYENEAKQASNDLAAAEQDLKQTEERIGVFQPDAQTKVLVEAYADLKAQVTAKQVEIQSMRAFATAENPELKRAEQELAALQAQVTNYERGQGGRPIEDTALEKVPTKALEFIRKYREVKYRESLWTLLLKQYEIARIDEGRDAAIIQVLDPAPVPERKSSPKRAIIVLSLTFFAFLVAMLWAYGKEAMERVREDPQYMARLQLLKFYLFHKDRSGDL